MNKDYLTIKEFSEMAGITPQAVYKRLNQKDSTLKPLVKTVERKKMIHINALKEFDSTEFNNQTTNPLNQVETVERDQTFKEIIEVMKNQVDLMSEQTDVLRGQLQQKDKQINDLNERLEQALKNTSEGHFVLAQHQQQSLDETIQNVIVKPWYKRVFKK